jgi:hypothetical protein
MGIKDIRRRPDRYVWTVSLISKLIPESIM